MEQIVAMQLNRIEKMKANHLVDEQEVRVIEDILRKSIDDINTYGPTLIDFVKEKVENLKPSASLVDVMTNSVYLTLAQNLLN